jgi:hypothetical protein
MLTTILAILSSAWSVLSKIISAIPWQVWAALAIFLFGGWVFYGGSCRDFACHRTRPVRPEKWEEYTITKAATGVSLESPLGIHGRRTKIITLSNIAAPSDGPLAEESRASLERLAGGSIRTEHQGIFRSDKSKDDKDEVEPLESRMLVCVVYSMSGQCLNTEQVRLGMAKLTSDAPKDWKEFENEAKKNRLGVWKK